MSSPLAMISYSWTDAEAAEVLHDELVLHGFEVIHDRYSFNTGSRVSALMDSAVERCDVFIPYVTASSLYVDESDGAPRPALNGELLPALRRRRRNLAPGRPDTPIVIPLTHGLGDRDTAGELIRTHIGEDLGSLWGPWLNQASSGIHHDEASLIAERALSSLLVRDQVEDELELVVVTRGDTPPPRKFTIDATRLVGMERRPGDPVAWARILRALQQVSRRLTHAMVSPRIKIELACHLTAAYAVGRTFHQATPWTPTFATRHGDATPSPNGEGAVLSGGFDQYAESGDLIIDIDLLGHGVDAPTDSLAASMARPAGRLSLTTPTDRDLTPAQLAATAYEAARRIRSAHAMLRPPCIHITMAAPAAFAALLGYHATALTSEVISYEFDGERYRRSMCLPPTQP